MCLAPFATDQLQLRYVYNIRVKVIESLYQFVGLDFPTTESDVK